MPGRKEDDKRKWRKAAQASQNIKELFSKKIKLSEEESCTTNVTSKEGM